jgi:hypothetical protein
MKDGCSVDINKIVVNQKYAQMYKPLSPEEYEDLALDIAKNGIMEPIIVEQQSDGTYVILSGHNRYEVAKKNGQKEIAIRIAETPKEKAWALMDNALRRQMTEEDRRAILAQEQTVTEEFLESALLPKIREMYKIDQLDRDTALFLAGLGFEVQTRILDDNGLGNLTARETPSHTEEQDAVIGELKGELDEALHNVEEAAIAKRALEATVEKERGLLDAKEREIKALNRQLNEIQADITERASAIAHEAEATIRKEMQKELKQATANQQKMWRELDEAKKRRKPRKQRMRRWQPSWKMSGRNTRPM